MNHMDGVRSPASRLNNASSTNASYEGYCPSCGDYTSLDNRTGFCAKCSAALPREEISNYEKVEQFLRENADHIEYYMVRGLSVSSAIDRLRTTTRPRCLSCGVFIKRAARNAVFCRNSPKCRKASRRYVYLYRERGFSKSDALAKVLSELTGE